MESSFYQFLSSEFDASIAANATALGFNPNNANAHYGEGLALCFAGRPEAAIPKVDEAWQRITGSKDSCFIFSHGENNEDVCEISELPEDFTACRVIIAAPDMDSIIKAKFMLAEDYWNGCNFTKTNWDKTVQQALDRYKERNAGCAQDYKDRVEVQPDWICVTVDYHS